MGTARSEETLAAGADRVKQAVAVAGVRAIGRFRHTAPLSDCVAIFGAPRSGTTWLAEVVQQLTGYGLISEPLYRDKLPEIDRFLPKGNRPYMNPASDSDELNQFLGRLFTGKELRAGYVRRDRSNLTRLIRSRPVITKEVRAQALLPYVRRNLPDLPVVLIVRDPRAVAASKVHDAFLVWRDRAVLSPSYRPLLRDFPEFEPPPGTRITPHVAATLEWFVEHAFLQDHQSDLEGVHLIRYEDLYANPAQVMEPIAEALGHAMSEAVVSTIRRPSASVTSGSALTLGGDPTSVWRDKIAPADQSTIRDLFAHYDRPFGYGEE